MGAADQQMGLPLVQQVSDRVGEFVASDSNEAARRWLEHAHEWPSGRLVLWGAAGCGKSHLARGWAGDAGLWLDPAALHLPNGALPLRVVVDRADEIRDDVGLLHLLNASAEAGSQALLTARSAPARWQISLADLASRLRSAACVCIDAADDVLLEALLVRALAERQLLVTVPVQQWLLRHLPRSAEVVHAAVARLDDAALAAGQPITRALARACLGDLLSDRGREADGDDGHVSGAQRRLML